MNKEIDFPHDDIDCWDRYPKHHWVYDLSRLLDAQNIKWSPFKTNSLSVKISNIELYSEKHINYESGYIYIEKPTEQHIITEIYLIKGDIKLIRHIDPVTNDILPIIIGGVELKLSAFISLYFQKYTGVLSITTYTNDIFKIKLRPYFNPTKETKTELIKLLKRIYKKVLVSDQSAPFALDQERGTG